MFKIGFYIHVIVLHLSVSLYIMWPCFDFQELNSPAVKKDKRSYGLMNGLKKESHGTHVKSYHDDSDVVRVTLMEIFVDLCYSMYVYNVL